MWNQEDSVASLILSKKKPCKLHLEDAVSVLGNLTLTAFGSSSGISMKDVESLVERNVQRALLSVAHTGQVAQQDKSFGNNKGNYSKNHSTGKRRSNPRGSSEGKIITCYDCGEKDHKRGDLRCKNPSFITKRRRMESSEKRHDMSKVPKTQQGTFFRPGSSSGQGKLA